MPTIRTETYTPGPQLVNSIVGRVTISPLTSPMTGCLLGWESAAALDDLAQTEYKGR